jgi:hypothetical protein
MPGKRFENRHKLWARPSDSINNFRSDKAKVLLVITGVAWAF